MFYNLGSCTLAMSLFAHPNLKIERPFSVHGTTFSVKPSVYGGLVDKLCKPLSKINSWRLAHAFPLSVKKSKWPVTLL